MIRDFLRTIFRLSPYIAIFYITVTMWGMAEAQTQTFITAVEQADRQAFLPGYAAQPTQVVCHPMWDAWLGTQTCQQ
jgi:hypothetical protein